MTSWFSERGFSPLEALSFLREQQALSAVVFHPDVTDPSPSLSKIVNTLSGHFDVIGHVDDWRRYLENWSTVAREAAGGPFLDQERTVRALLSHTPFPRWSKDILDSRLAGDQEHALQGTWEDVLDWGARHIPVWISGVPALGGNPLTSDSRARLERFCVEHQLHHVRLPALCHNDQGFIGELDVKLGHAGHVFLQAAGLSKTHTGLGLGNKAGLQVGFETVIRASCRGMGQGGSTLRLSATHPDTLQALGHEWFHAMDILAGHNSGVLGLMSESARARMEKGSTPAHAPWQRLLNSLDLPVPEAHLLVEQKKANWQNRWQEALPGLHGWVKNEALAFASPAWTANACVARWTPVLSKNKDPNGAWKACVLAAELAVLGRGSQNPWRDVARETQRLAALNPETMGMAGYLEEAPEILAHSFEARIGRMDASLVLKDPTFRHPSAEETVFQEKAWNDFAHAMALGAGFSPTPVLPAIASSRRGP
jgi:hypothetical protein